MITLCLGILFVYVLLFQVKGKSLQTASSTISSGAELTIGIRSGETVQTLTPVSQVIATITGTIEPKGGNLLSWSRQIQNPTLLTNTSLEKTGVINILSGTNIFYGSIQVIEKLWIKYLYALVDQQDIYYINLGNPSYDFWSITRKLGGSVYELKTEAEINQNKLFGNKVTFINLPEYKDKKVVMIISQGDTARLIRVDYAKYHKVKSYIKSLFIQ